MENNQKKKIDALIINFPLRNNNIINIRGKWQHAALPSYPNDALTAVTQR
jgi:hypothetical protein